MNPCDLRLNNLPETTRRWSDVSPSSVEGVVRAVDDAANGRRPREEPCVAGDAPKTAKAIGAGWGFSPAGTTLGTRVRTTNLFGVEVPADLLPSARPLPMPFNPLMPNEEPGPLRRVYAGNTFAMLDQLLAPYSVRNQPGFGDLTFGGVMMVGGHGSGLVEGNIASQVRSLDLVVVTAERRAKLVRIEPSSNPITDPARFSGELILDDELFACAKVSFGSMGVLTSAVIDTRPAYRLEEDRDLRRLWRDFEKIERQVREPSVSAVHLWINPYEVGGDFLAVQSTYRRCFDTKRNERGLGIRTADTRGSRWLAYTVARYLPRLLPLAHELALHMVTGGDVVMPSAEALDFGPPNRLQVAAASCAVDAADLKGVLEALLQHFHEGFGRTFVSSPVGIRWVKGSDAPLAPQHGRDSVMIEVPVLAGTPFLDDTLSAYVDFMVNKLGGRPHWGQRLSLTPAQLRRLYGEEQVARFIAARRRLDPLGVFENELTEKLGLGVGGASVEELARGMARRARAGALVGT